LYRNVFITGLITIILSSCGSEETVIVDIPAVVEDSVAVESYNKGGFITGFWAKKFSLEVVADGDLNFNVDWSYIKTYVEDGAPKLFIQDPMDGLEYSMLYEDSNFIIINDFMDSRVENIEFTPSGLNHIVDNRSEAYMEIDSGRVIYDYYFEGIYRNENAAVPNKIELGCKGNVLGWGDALTYESHYNFEKPVFVLRNETNLLETYYIQDHKDGFQLFEITNKNELTQAQAVVEVGGLKYTFIKS
jgi:hypothetical protein